MRSEAFKSHITKMIDELSLLRSNLGATSTDTCRERLDVVTRYHGYALDELNLEDGVPAGSSAAPAPLAPPAPVPVGTVGPDGELKLKEPDTARQSDDSMREAVDKAKNERQKAETGPQA